jgi:hypothetical protein
MDIELAIHRNSCFQAFCILVYYFSEQPFFRGDPATLL